MTNDAKPELAIFTYFLPSHTTGGPVLDFEIIKFLSDHYKLYLIHSRGIDQIELDAKHLLNYIKERLEILLKEDFQKSISKLKRLIVLKPRNISLINNSSSSETVQQFLEQHQINKLFFTSIWATQLSPELDFAKYQVYCLTVNIEHKLYNNLPFNLKNTLERFIIKRFEEKILPKVPKLATLTEKDKNFIQKWIGKENIAVCPPFMEPKPTETKKQDSKTALITTNISYEPNFVSIQWFIQSVLPHIDNDITINITGKDKNNYLKKLSQENSQINYAGFLNTKNFQNEFEKAHLIINPTIIGSGFQVKILDAIARNIPLISTKFSNHLGDQILSSDNPEALAKLINGFFKLPLKNSFNYTEYYNHATTNLLKFLKN